MIYFLWFLAYYVFGYITFIIACVLIDKRIIVKDIQAGFYFALFWPAIIIIEMTYFLKQYEDHVLWEKKKQ